MDSFNAWQPGDQHPVPSLEIKRRTGEHQHWKGEDKCAMLPGIEPGPAAMGQELAQSRIMGQQPAAEKQKAPRHEHGNEGDKPGRGRHLLYLRIQLLQPRYWWRVPGVNEFCVSVCIRIYGPTGHCFIRVGPGVRGEPCRAGHARWGRRRSRGRGGACCN